MKTLLHFRSPPRSLLLVAGILLLSNAVVSSLCGLGDAEALYYNYGLHLSFSYLDHPPLIGWLIRISTTVFGQTVIGVRVVAMGMCLLCLISTTRLTREMYGDEAAGLVPYLMLATPVFAVGMTAATPDAPLSALWPVVTLQLYRALFTDPSPTTSWRVRLRPLGIGLLLGLAFLAKYTGALLVVTTLLMVSRKEARAHLRRPMVWCGALIAAAVAMPVFIWNIRHDWAGALHRLSWTQGGAGVSLRNAGALIGGQLLYVGPPMLWLFFRALKSGFARRDRRRNEDAFRILAAASLPTLIAGYLLVLWSKVAEPHWPAAGYLPLFPLAAHYATAHPSSGKRVAKLAIGFGIVAFSVMHLLVLTPLVPLLTPADRYEPKYDLANELTGWPEVAEQIRDITPAGLVVTSGFYTQCAQLRFALNRPSDPKVRCISEEIDDFDIWHPAKVDAPFVFVDDNRFNHDVTKLASDAEVRATHDVEIFRGGRSARRFRIRLVDSKPSR